MLRETLFVALGFLIVFRVLKENTFASSVIEVAHEQRVIETPPASDAHAPRKSPFCSGTPWWRRMP
jgi:hypothetical protein